MTSPPEADLHRPLFSCGVVLTVTVCLFICWNLRVSRGVDDLAMCRDTVNLRLTGCGGDARPDRAGSGSWAAAEASDSSAKNGDRGAVLWSRSSTMVG